MIATAKPSTNYSEIIPKTSGASSTMAAHVDLAAARGPGEAALITAGGGAILLVAGATPRRVLIGLHSRPDPRQPRCRTGRESGMHDTQVSSGAAFEVAS